MSRRSTSHSFELPHLIISAAAMGMSHQVRPIRSQGELIGRALVALALTVVLGSLLG
jgi:hypothetical protein